jgi:hypothetical protein
VYPTMSVNMMAASWRDWVIKKRNNSEDTNSLYYL